jgi:hypothetical protein
MFDRPLMAPSGHKLRWIPHCTLVPLIPGSSPLTISAGWYPAVILNVMGAS